MPHSEVVSASARYRVGMCAIFGRDRLGNGGRWRTSRAMIEPIFSGGQADVRKACCACAEGIRMGSGNYIRIFIFIEHKSGGGKINKS